jgi:DNA gyrase subunit A
VQVADGEQIMLISDRGTLVRTRVDEVPVLSRNTQGVRLIKLKSDESLVGVSPVAEPDESEVSSLPEDDADSSAESPGRESGGLND